MTAPQLRWRGCFSPAAILFATRAAARFWRCRSAPIIATIWRRRETRSARSCVASSGSGRIVGFVASTKWAITAASIGSVLARLHSAFGEGTHLRRIEHDDRQARTSHPAATTVSNPPVASTAMAAGPKGLSLSIRAAIPSPSRLTKNASPLGRTATSSRSFDTSIPTMTVASILSHSCASGLRDERPKRLFGVDGSAGEDPSSLTGLVSLRAAGLLPATATAGIADEAK